MGSTLSVCGLGTGHDDTSSKQHPRVFEREKMMELLAHSDRSRSLSVTTDTSVASILSSSDRLIPDAFMPVDIQVVSQRRVRPASSSVLTAQSHRHRYSHSGGNGGSVTPSSSSSKVMGNNHYYSNSAHAHAAFLRYMTSSTSATTTDSMPPSTVVAPRKQRFAVDVSPDLDATVRSRRRSNNQSHLSARDLVKGC